LDAFMNNLEAEERQGPQHNERSSKQDNEIGEEDGEERKMDGVMGGGEILENEASGDEDSLSPQNRKIIESLHPFDFSQVHLEEFTKNFYTEHEDIAVMSTDTRNKLMYPFRTLGGNMKLKSRGRMLPNQL
jgi:hypothetical protein